MANASEPSSYQPTEYAGCRSLTIGAAIVGEKSARTTKTLTSSLAVPIRPAHESNPVINERFYEKVIKVKADVAAVLNIFRAHQVPETLVDQRER